MFVLNISELKTYIDTQGLKQKAIAERCGMTETAFSLIVQGKRKCEAGEYANICRALNVPFSRFLNDPEKEVV